MAGRASGPIRVVLVFVASCGTPNAPASSDAAGDATGAVDEPVFDPATGTLVMQDDMDRYASATEMGAVPLGSEPRIAPHPSPVLISMPVDESATYLVAGRGGAGKALRMAYNGVAQGSLEWEAFNVPIPPDAVTHYFSYWARVSFASPLTNPLSVKWFEAWHRDVDRVQWNTHWPDPGHPNATGSSSGTYWQVYDQGRETFGQGDQPLGPHFDDVLGGSWHRFTHAYRPQSAAGGRDGFARMWIDGSKVIDISAATLDVVPPGGDKVWCGAQDLDALTVGEGIRVVVWGSTQTTDTPPWTYDIDDFIWWTVP